MASDLSTVFDGIEAIHERGQPDNSMVIEFNLAGAPMMILTACSHYKLTPAAYISVLTDDQDETDRLWGALTGNDGEPYSGLRMRSPREFIAA